MALLALFVALGGTSLAAGNVLLPRNSVGTAQLKNGAVTKPKIARRTVASLRGARGVPGPRGATGAQGPQGVQGLPGADGAPGTARAYAIVYAAGPVFLGSFTRNFISVNRAATGRYCLTPAAGINPATTPAIVSVEYQTTNPPVGNASVSYRASQLDCASNQYDVVTQRLPTSGDVSAVDADDVSFSIIVP